MFEIFNIFNIFEIFDIIDVGVEMEIMEMEMKIMEN